MTATYFSYGKIIISGEHSVVYGHPAFAVPLPIGVTVALKTSNTPHTNSKTHPSPFLQHVQTICEEFTQKTFLHLEVKISSQLPQNAGLGSSAALAHAYIGAYLQLSQITASPDQLFKLILECERFAHANPSGLDAAVVVHQRPLVFTKNERDHSFQYKPVSFFPLSDCLVISSGSATESTGEMVAHVAKHPQRDDLLGKIAHATQNLLQALENHHRPWKFLTENQRLIEQLGVVSDQAQRIVHAIEAIGGTAKVCGAGGIKTGAGVILAYHPDKQQLLQLTQQNNWPNILRNEL